MSPLLSVHSLAGGVTARRHHLVRHLAALAGACLPHVVAGAHAGEEGLQGLHHRRRPASHDGQRGGAGALVPARHWRIHGPAGTGEGRREGWGGGMGRGRVVRSYTDSWHVSQLITGNDSECHLGTSMTWQMCEKQDGMILSRFRDTPNLERPNQDI